MIARPSGGLSMAMSIGEVAARVQCSVETIRYYERIKVISSSNRTEGGHRVYNEDHIRELGVVLRARTLGFSLERVRALVRILGERANQCDDMHEIARAHLLEIRARIAELAVLENSLTMLSANHAQDQQCPLVEALTEGPT
jgi:MerR family transcriptional regulator, mercuric resistance operon regulatory protein